MTEKKMTRDELLAKMAANRTSAEDYVRKYNEAMQTGNFEEAVKMEAALDEAIGEYTHYAKTLAFEECAAAEDPMLHAITVLSFQTIKVKDEKAGDEKVKIPVRTLIDVDKPIDLYQLHKYIPDGIGKDKKWPYMVEAFNCKLTARVAQAIGVPVKEITDSYAMSDISREIDLGKNPTSNTNLLKTLQGIINAMIGEEYKVTSHDVAFLLEAYSKKSRKALTLTVSNHKSLRNLMAEISHRVVCDQRYAVDFKKRRENTPVSTPVESEESKPAVKSKKSKAITEGEATELPAVPAA